MGTVSKYDLLKAEALLNFESLLQLWNITYAKEGDEYDFLNPTREDKHLGACKFNTKKGIGADFAGCSFSSEDMRQVGSGLTRDDFCDLAFEATDNWGFDVVGLCGRIHGSKDYATATELLRDSLEVLRSGTNFNRASREGIRKQAEVAEHEIKAKIERAEKIWQRCVPIKGTKAETYLANRGIEGVTDEPNIRYHERMHHKDTGKYLPTVVFRVQAHPQMELTAIHRIYLNEEGTSKIATGTAKMAFGRIRGCGIWFGAWRESALYIVEGPEDALSLRVMGAPSVCCAISAVNFGSLRIPQHVKEVKLFPDNDEAGRNACARAVHTYQLQGKQVSYKFPPAPEGEKKFDWNDMLMSQRNERGKEESSSSV